MINGHCAGCDIVTCHRAVFGIVGWGVSVYDWDSQCGIWLQRRSAICFPTKHEQPVNSSCRQLIDMRPFEFWIASGIGKQHGVIGAAQGVFRADKRWIGESAFKVRGHQTDESVFATWCLNIGCFDIPKLIGCFENKSSCMCGELTCVVQSLETVAFDTCAAAAMSSSVMRLVMGQF